ncbi:MAG TPA: FAD-dependent oxidoreductase [Candidatus Saccharimonadales bacterium]|nr:FAD-dependent oxidoreductase [Candidatus Saccharimonadales bacterium]
MKIVVVGGGFAGVRAALSLSKRSGNQVILMANRPCFEYHAALYRTLTGRSVLEVSVPLSRIFGRKPVDVVEDSAKTIDVKAKVIIGQSGRSYSYDVAVLAPGNVTAYFGIEGLAEYSYSLKTVDDALRLRNHLHHALVSGDVDLNYVVVGAGPSGVELAGEMVAYLKRIRKRHMVERSFNVSLVEAAPRVLPSLTEEVSRRATKRLKAIGVKVFTNTAVRAETANDLQLPEGSIKTHTVIWTAGVTGNPFFTDNPDVFKLSKKGGRVVVDNKLRAAKNVFVIGDSADTPESGWAQTAIYDANFISKVIAGRNPTYKPPKPIGAIPIGGRWCIVSGRLRVFWGYPGWLARRWLDWSIFSHVLPSRLAIKSWVYGTKREENCEVCSH